MKIAQLPLAHAGRCVHVCVRSKLQFNVKLSVRV
jgi:hypothetical protein